MGSRWFMPAGVVPRAPTEAEVALCGAAPGPRPGEANPLVYTQRGRPSRRRALGTRS